MKRTNFFNNLRRRFLLPFFVINTIASFGQVNRDSIISRYTYANIISVGGDTMLVFSKKDKPRPTVIFITGSSFIPLFVNGNCVATPFNPYKLIDDYNLVVLNKPGIPVFADSTDNPYLEEAVAGGVYRSKLGMIPALFTKNNHLQAYLKSYERALDVLNQQSWVLKSRFILIGHSQGTNIALKLAIERSSYIWKIVLMSPGSPFNRFHEFIRDVRQLESFHQIVPVEAQKKIDSIYVRHKELIRNKENTIDKYDAFSFQSYYSFVYPTRSEMLLKLTQETLVTYGTDGVKDIECDYLPIFLADHGKMDVDIKVYPGYDHNYFENVFSPEGDLTDRKFHWDEVIADVFEWLTK